MNGMHSWRPKKALKDNCKNNKVKGLKIEYAQQDEMHRARLETDKNSWKAKHRKAIGRLSSLRQLVKKHGVQEIDSNTEMVSLKKKSRVGTRDPHDYRAGHPVDRRDYETQRT